MEVEEREKRLRKHRRDGGNGEEVEVEKKWKWRRSGGNGEEVKETEKRWRKWRS